MMESCEHCIHRDGTYCTVWNSDLEPEYTACVYYDYIEEEK